MVSQQASHLQPSLPLAKTDPPGLIYILHSTRMHCQTRQQLPLCLAATCVLSSFLLALEERNCFFLLVLGINFQKFLELPALLASRARTLSPYVECILVKARDFL